MLATRRPPLTKAMYFDVSKWPQYVKIPYSSSSPLFTISGPLTIEALIIPIKFFQWGGVFSVGSWRWTSPAYSSFAMQMWNDVGYTWASTGRLRAAFNWNLSNALLLNSKTVLYSYNSYHTAIVWDGSYVYMYINGALDPATPYSWSGPIKPPDPSHNAYVGADPPGEVEYFWGYILLVRVYNRALNRSEILHNMRNLNNPVRDGLVLWLDARAVSGNTWYDLSGYGNHGTIYGATQVSLPNPPGGW